ncbi:IS110 family RNA-guided transposase [Paraglaciecola hydrolytica]|uniref:Transposase n=1 Tax=Paraglaciecola hydrolytica TaxID=1799789 RepID=A0A136A6U3_9ALTE|nr:IS110 family transposase [Paraglaciecola hydrolytica]KXI30958.1 transposase [Paraglaciecola hydrolytica]
MNVTLIGIDLAKSIFQVCGVNQAGKSVFNRTVKRKDLLAFLMNYPDATIAMEACSGSNYWGRALEHRGFKVLLIPPIHVKPFVKGNKNDRNDAFAITEAARRPNMHFVRPRTVEQTDMMMVHKLRKRRVDARTALMNQLRGLLNEYGIVLRAGKSPLKNALDDLQEDAENGLTWSARELIRDIQQEWKLLDDVIDSLDKQIKTQAQANPNAKRLMTIRGVAEKTATTVIAFAGDGKAYKNGRHFSANLRLVPKEHSSGGKQQLGGITKRGNPYLRNMLIQGAWSVLRNADKNNDRLSCWARKIVERRGKHKAVVAIANKLARIIWSVLYHQRDYQAV